MSLVTCDTCGQVLPLIHFPAPELGMNCEFCLRGEESNRVDTLLTAKARDISAKMADSADPANVMPRAKDFVAAMYAEFGGPRGYASYLADIINRLASQPKPPASVGMLMLNLVKMQMTIEQNESSQDARTMTDEQIEREQKLALMRLGVEVANDPIKQKVFFKMLEQQGIKAESMSPKESLDALIEQADDEV